jgi:hypothetical protein
MNKTEQAYGQYLDTLKFAGEVRWWAFQPVRLLIAQGDKAAYYRPDFWVQLADGSFEFHETKGFEREAALVRIKVAAGLYPIPFVLVKRDGGMGWTRELFGARLGGPVALPEPAGEAGAGRRPAKPAGK